MLYKYRSKNQKAGSSYSIKKRSAKHKARKRMIQDRLRSRKGRDKLLSRRIKIQPIPTGTHSRTRTRAF